MEGASSFGGVGVDGATTVGARLGSIWKKMKGQKLPRTLLW